MLAFAFIVHQRECTLVEEKMVPLTYEDQFILSESENFLPCLAFIL